MAKTIPKFTYTGTSSTRADDNYWYIELKSNGNLTFTSAAHNVDVFLVGGGGGGAGAGLNGFSSGGGGGGGYTKTARGLTAAKGTAYPAVIGAGGAGGISGTSNGAAGNGGATSFMGQTANGGQAGALPAELSRWSSPTGGNGGSGGGAGGGRARREGFDDDAWVGGKGGSNGSGGYRAIKANGDYSIVAGAVQELWGSKGQGTTTRAFGESGGALYAGGGGGGSSAAVDNGVAGGSGGGGAGGVGSGDRVRAATAGQANTGGGGGGGGADAWAEFAKRDGAAGGSGVVIIRGSDADELPIRFNRQGGITQVIYNGQPVTSLYYNGTKVF